MYPEVMNSLILKKKEFGSEMKNPHSSIFNFLSFWRIAPRCHALLTLKIIMQIESICMNNVK
jgi:hypothetical protein